MRLAAPLSLCLLLISTPTVAQTVITPPKYDPAPWWMDQPILASTGFVEAEVPANRANLGAGFTGLGKTLPEANEAAAAKAQALNQALGRLGADRVRTQITLTVQPIYEQYRDREGNRIDNARADRIEQYEATAHFQIEVRDMGVMQQVIGAVIAAAPATTTPVSYHLEPTNEMKTEMALKAVQDAARRARQATEATGARLGAVKLIDPTGRACQTDVLVAGAPQSYGPGYAAQSVAIIGAQEFMQRGSPTVPPPPPPPPPMAPAPAGAISGVVTVTGRPATQALLSTITVQPPIQKMMAQSCVVYALAG